MTTDFAATLEEGMLLFSFGRLYSRSRGFQQNYRSLGRLDIGESVGFYDLPLEGTVVVVLYSRQIRTYNVCITAELG